MREFNLVLIMGGNTITFMQKNLPGATSSEGGGGCNSTRGAAVSDRALWWLLPILLIALRRRARATAVRRPL